MSGEPMKRITPEMHYGTTRIPSSDTLPELPQTTTDVYEKLLKTKNCNILHEEGG